MANVARIREFILSHIPRANWLNERYTVTVVTEFGAESVGFRDDLKTLYDFIERTSWLMWLSGTVSVEVATHTSRDTAIFKYRN